MTNQTYNKLKEIIVEHEFINHNGKYDSIKIIGRPITLEDTLRVASKLQHYSYIVDWLLYDLGHKSDTRWVFGKSLEDQADDLGNFLLKNL